MNDFSIFTTKTKRKTSRSQDQKTTTSRSQDQKAAAKQSSYDIEIRRLKNHGIEIRGLKHHNIEKPKQLTHDFVILRHFFRGRKTTPSRFQDWKTTTSGFQDQKATTSSFCGFLTLMLPDRCSVFFSSAFRCSWFYNMPIQVDYTEFAESAEYLPFFIDKRTA